MRPFPPILYKYCSPCDVAILTDRTLKVTPPSEFNDPFEFCPVVKGAITPEDVQLRLPDPEWLPGKILRQQNDSIALSTIPDNRRWQFYEELAATFNNNLATWANGHCNWVSKTFGVVCLSEVSDSVLMWSHYSDKHRGFVIGIDHRKIGKLQPCDVKYEPERVSMSAKAYLWHDGVSPAEAILTHKSPEWGYEREWRLLISLDAPYLADENIKGKPCKVLRLGDSIAEVWMGHRSTPRLQRLIREALDKMGSNANVGRFRLHPSEYKLIPE